MLIYELMLFLGLVCGPLTTYPVQGVEAVSEHSVTGSSAQALSGKVLDRMMKVLETESHEGTLIQALTSLSAWTAKFTTDIPQKLIDFLPVSESC